jgi:hypothetical protein
MVRGESSTEQYLCPDVAVSLILISTSHDSELKLDSKKITAVTAAGAARTGRFLCVMAGIGLFAGAPGPVLSAAAAAQASSEAAHPSNWQTVEEYCFGCHNDTDWAGGIAFDTMSPGEVGDDPKIWESAIKKLKSGLMPPPTEKQPERVAVRSMIGWLETTLDKAQEGSLHVGHVPLRRLNRREYANSIRDLLALEIDPATWLPQDPLKDDFDTNAELLQMNATFIDQALMASRSIALLAVGDPKSVPLETTYGSVPNMILSLAAVPAAGSGNQHRFQDGMPYGTRGGMSTVHNFPADGEYVLTIGDMALARTVPNMEFENTVIALLDGKEFWRTTLGGEADHTAIDQRLDDAVAQINGRLKNIRFKATAGQHTIAVTFLQRSNAESDSRTLLYQPGDDRRPANALEGGQYRMPAVNAFQVKGPVKITGMSDSPSRKKVFTCRPTGPAGERACAQVIIGRLARQAFRRPVTNEDLAPLLKFYEKGRTADGFEGGVREAIAAILVSSDFLYRAESAPVAEAREVTPLELASRLSFALWSSLPDERLLKLAEQGKLARPEVLRAELARMIADPRAISLTRDFGFQWLNIAKMDAIVPSAALFQHASGVYDPRPAFRKELELFMDSILRSSRPVTDLLTADHTFLNEQVALVYGYTDIRGNGFHRVKLADPKRFGLLGKGAVLMVTANPNRTAPVLRGAWIMERILGTPKPTPPPNVPDLSEAVKGRPATVREQTELHRTNKTCASCHRVMDPLGFALENFDTVGAYRKIDPQTRQAIDAAGTMPDGQSLAGPEELHQALAAHSDQFAQIITEKLMTYAVGRLVDHDDMPAVRGIVRKATTEGLTFESLLWGVINSDAFRRRAPAPQPKAATAQNVSKVQ